MKNFDSTRRLVTAVTAATAVVLTSVYYVAHNYTYLAHKFAMEYLLPPIVQLLRENQLCQVLVFGSISAYFVLVANTIWRTFILPRVSGFTSSVVIHNDDPNFNAVIDFIGDKLPYENQGAKCSLRASTKSQRKNRKDHIREWLGSGQDSTQSFDFRPDSDQAIHRVQYKGYTVYLTRNKLSQPLMGNRKPFTPESLTLTVWGSDNAILKQLMAEALEAHSEQAREGTIRIYTLCTEWWATAWELALTKPVRPKESVILDQKLMESLLADARCFLAGGRWYAEKGIPYRRGYMLHGPPGCGKTSFAQVLAGELKLDLCMMNMSDESLTDNKFAEFLREAPARSIIVLEDIDAIFVDSNINVQQKRATKGSNRQMNIGNGVSFSGLLNGLDGVASQEGRIVLMTTNHIERLDPALVRPGRCDVQVQLTLASRMQIERFFLRFFPRHEDLAKQFAAQLPAGELSMAKLQGYFQEILQKHNSSAYIGTEDGIEVGCDSSGWNVAVECVEHAQQLLKPTLHDFHRTTAVPYQSEVKFRAANLKDHLSRLSLERYLPLLASQGVYFIEDLKNFTLNVDSIAVLNELSVDLQYDIARQQRLRVLLDTKSECHAKMLNEDYILADVADIRDLFLAAYHSPNLNEVGRDDNHQSEEMDGAQILKLSEAFCAKLSHGGRGLVSMFNLRRLLNNYPSQPASCVDAADSFSTNCITGSSHLQEMKYVDIKDFLARAAIRTTDEILNMLREVDIECVSDLLQLRNCDSSADKVVDFVFGILYECGFNKKASLRLAEIVCKHRSASGNYAQFFLIDRTAVISLFISFFTSLTEYGFDSERQCEIIEDQFLRRYLKKDDSNENICDGITAPDCVENNTDCRQEMQQDKPIELRCTEVPEDERGKFSMGTLHQCANAFATVATNHLGDGLASRIQIIHFLLSLPARDPHLAVRGAIDGTLLSNHCVYGIDAARHSIVECKERYRRKVCNSWVYSWFLQAERDGPQSGSLCGLHKHAQAFFDNGMRDRADLVLICDRGISDSDLTSMFKVRNYGHRKKIQAMLKELSTEVAAKSSANE